MAVVESYNAQVMPQGELQAHRQMGRPEDFGASIGTGMQQLGQAGDATAGMLNQVQTAEDVTNMHVQFANARAQLSQQIQQMENGATPGDPNFANKVIDHVQQTLGSLGDAAQTREGQNVAQQLAAGMTADFGQRAVAFQGELAARGAQNQYAQLQQSLGQTVYADPNQFNSSLKQGLSAIDDPNSIFARVPQSTRDSLKQKLQNDLTFARMSKQAEVNPDGVLGLIDQKSLDILRPYAKAITGTAAPGAKVSISPPAMKYAPTALHAAAANGVNGNILLAQIDAESGGNPNAVSPKGAKGISQFMPETAAQYGVDVNDPVSSINGQAKMMGDLLRAYGGDYTKALAAYNYGSGNVAKLMHLYGDDWQKHLPTETQDYIAKVMQKAGAIAPPQTIAEANMPPATNPETTGYMPQDASIGTPIDGLTWEQTDQLAQKSVRTSLLRLAVQARTQEEALKQRTQQQKSSLDGYIQKIIEPGKYGAFSTDEVLADPVLDWNQKQHLVDYSMTYGRQVEGQSHPGEVRSLMLQIHAADDDPTKTYNMGPVDQAYKNGQINTTEYKFLRTEVSQMQSGDGAPFQKKVNQAREVVYQSLMRSQIGSVMPNVAASAAYTFNFDLEKKIEEYRKANKDPSSLLDPSSRDYMMKPDVIQSYLTNARQAFSAQAPKVVQAGKGSLPNYTDYDKLQSGASYTDPQGNVRIKK